jgi:hypothetical protein
MKEKKQYIAPTSIMVVLSSMLNAGDWNPSDETGGLVLGSGEIDAGKGQGKEADIPDTDAPLWED